MDKVLKGGKRAVSKVAPITSKTRWEDSVNLLGSMA